jgi:predicted RNA-binding Zn ribbon-like protein
MSEYSSAENVPLEGGELCLDFTNTVSWRSGPKRREMLNSYSDLITWSVYVGILEKKIADDLKKYALKDPREAEKVYSRAIELRDTLFRIFESIVAKTQVQNGDLRIFNRYFADSMGRSCCIKNEEGEFVWSFCSQNNSLDIMLNPIVKSAANLLVSLDLIRVKKCADEYCGWLFIDNSRNRSRRWCNMKDCGNRAKARRHYQRTHRANSEL